ncbi:hypothetical protein HNY73_006074 [Argiope bruennichi]|uniref:DUF4817 domain-containing protein n=1 Tax=Argiope bruennichi TaxID=94029 RepID=A0A8T0FLQ5_ARGBR|nr:hypothetical protein HNY73_006074 [Argiope bruennichi]
MNMPLTKKEHLLTVKLFYQNASNASAAIRDYRQLKNLRKGHMSASAIKGMMWKFEEIDYLDVASKKGRCRTEPAIVEEVSIASASS